MDFPFSYQTGVVSHGASSPLHVVVFGLVFALFGDYWLSAAKIINFGFIFVAMIILQRGLRLPVVLFPLLVSLVSSFSVLMASTAEMFEIGLVVLSISILYVLLKLDHRREVVVVAGLLHLVRPELILITFAVYAVCLFKYREIRLLKVMLFMGLVVFGYYVYMVLNGAGWLPSSVVGRALKASEDQIPWVQNFFQSARLLLINLDNPYLFCFTAFFVYAGLMIRRDRFPLCEVLIVVPILALYMIFPPGVYIPRYMVPSVPVISFVSVWLIGKVFLQIRDPMSHLFQLQARAKNFSGWMGMLSCGLALVWVFMYAPWNGGFYKVTQEEILLPRLAQVVNQVAGPEDKILVYEIQSQFYMKAEAIGMTVIGKYALDFLQRKESLEDFLKRERIRYVVTMNSFNYRRIYNNTALVDLYVHDLSNGIGSTLEVNGITYTKIATNPDFADPKRYQVKTFGPMNYDNQLRLYGPNSHRAGTHITWNSLYKVFSS
ncbi:MAG: hypothetical protein OEZ51_01925 [Nitrospinota bacterium]|nr:hypothetical protein [Nitrospinota bacterium]